MLKKITVALCTASLLAACNPMMSSTAPTSGQPRPAFRDTVVGMATVSSLLVAVELKRQQTQEKLQSRTNPQDIAKWQAHLTAIDALKGNLLNYSNGQLTLADRISLITASSDLVKSRLPEYTDIINTLSTVSQVLLAAQAQAAQTAPASLQATPAKTGKK